MGYNGRLSLKLLEKSVKVQNLPYPLLRGQPLKLHICSKLHSSALRICKNIWLLSTPSFVDQG